MLPRLQPAPMMIRGIVSSPGRRTTRLVSAFVVLVALASKVTAAKSAFTCSPLGLSPNLSRGNGRSKVVPGPLKYPKSHSLLKAWGGDDEDLQELEEEARLKVQESRRKQIRSALKSAESLRNFRVNNGFVPELDEDGNPIKSDSKTAVTLTAFVVAAGAVVLRVGGRAALVSTLGLDFAKENPELKDNLDTLLNYAASLDLPTEAALFVLAWTGVKVFCFDAGGIVLAFASGILFGGVLQGAVFSALAATIGSSVAFTLAKLDTPFRKKALELVDEYPSLRGIEKVVAKDGLKAILTLRLAPVLPIPLGLYNYVYGVTNVPFLDFAGGIFLGSLKPYLLDSYLGVFLGTVVDGSVGTEATTEDLILLVILGVSVLIGVFASQLAGETWESVTAEIEAEKLEKKGEDGDEDDGIAREIFGIKVPQVLVGFQLALQKADERVGDMINVEYSAKVWNYTDSDGGVPKNMDPSFFPASPEIADAGKSFDFGASICDGLVLSPSLFKAYLKYADPLYNGEDEVIKDPKRADSLATVAKLNDSDAETDTTAMSSGSVLKIDNTNIVRSEDEQLLEVLQTLRARTKERLLEIDELMK